MAKRRADKQLNKDEPDIDEEPEDRGEFQKADSNVLANRVIRTAKRRSLNNSDTPSPLANFSGFSSAPKGSPFSFFSKINSQQSNNVATENVIHRDLNALRSLNLSCSSWIQQHLEKNPYVSLLPVFRDYEKHLASLNMEGVSTACASSTKITLSSSTTTLSAPSLFNFGAAKTTDSTQPTFSFGLNSQSSIRQTTTLPSAESKTDDPTTNKSEPLNSIFETNAENTKTSVSQKPSFIFGLNNGSVGTTNSSVASTAVTSVGNDFLQKGPTPVQRETEGDDPSDEPPQYDFVPVGEEGSVFDTRCKVFFKKEGSYAAVGVGTLFLKPVAGGKTQLIARADTAQGSILLNFILTAEMPLQRMGKNNVLLVCLPTPDAKPPPTTVLIRVSSADERDRLLSEIERLKGS